MERLTKPGDFSLCYKKGKMHKGKYVVVYSRANGLTFPRIGFSVSKKLGKAVRRNKVKRRLRAIMQQEQERIKTGVDLVIAARMPASGAEYAPLQAGLQEGLKRLGVLE